jgi:hypothetical protein
MPSCIGLSALSWHREDHPHLRDRIRERGLQHDLRSGSVATYLNGTLRLKVSCCRTTTPSGTTAWTTTSPRSPVRPDRGHPGRLCRQRLRLRQRAQGRPIPNQAANPGQVDGEGCVYPARSRPSPTSSTPSTPPTERPTWRRGGPTTRTWATRRLETAVVADPTGGTDCGHPALGATDTAEFATAEDQYTTRHNPFVWFHSIIDNTGRVRCQRGAPGHPGSQRLPPADGHLATDLRSQKTTPRFAFITPNLCSDGHDGTCAGLNSTGPTSAGWSGPTSSSGPGCPSSSTPRLQARRHAGRHHLRRGRRRPSSPAYAAACCNGETVPGPTPTLRATPGLATDVGPGWRADRGPAAEPSTSPGAPSTPPAPTTTTRRCAATRTCSG